MRESASPCRLCKAGSYPVLELWVQLDLHSHIAVPKDIKPEVMCHSDEDAADLADVEAIPGVGQAHRYAVKGDAVVTATADK